MRVIQIGSMAILGKWLILGVSVLIGLVIIQIWLKRTQSPQVKKTITDLLTNSVLIGFIIWKGSLVVLEPVMVLKSPFVLLYFTGGSEGLILAIIFVITYFIIKGRKAKIVEELMLQTMFLFSFAVIGSYHFFYLILLGDQVIYHLILGLFSVIVIISNWKGDRRKHV